MPRRHVTRWRERLGKRYPRLRALVRGKPAVGTRRHIRPNLTVEGFFDVLNDRGVSYAVLRWFDDLPHVQPGEDIDMLIHDDDLQRVGDLFAPGEGVPCDIYSPSGRPGSTFHGMPYFPYGPATVLLKRSVLLKNQFRVPSPEDHFLSLAYHALYHKGVRSGLPTATPNLEPISDPEHDYAAVLNQLALKLGLNVDIQMEQLDDHLASNGWRPTAAMAAGLSKRNSWVAARYASLRGSVEI